eukprot:CAMPEP_0198464716 /NCGR_PEP_ID=MMETSP1456-20131121/2790_1 /TAXON_ID=1461544 ORGANISM="Unidentified sp., Strain RCC1871" /NCGR_SAMPLE_ID=MMETSP1456 /ASSEMBLY_ACC=CAM_ASM_001119 /LENGTH=104 /DNA_ID=CAMNT_0044190451 /DNA_START=248 /DNA_END=562 /DNA_ORIENTATION=-
MWASTKLFFSLGLWKAPGPPPLTLLVTTSASLIVFTSCFGPPGDAKANTSRCWAFGQLLQQEQGPVSLALAATRSWHPLQEHTLLEAAPARALLTAKCPYFAAA